MWLEFFGLNKQPFGVTPDPGFLYMGPAHQEAFASMVYGIETGRGFMALVAAPGMGKTTLLLRLMERLRDTTVTAYLFQVHTNSQEFLKNLLLDLDVQPAGQDMSDLQNQVQEVLIRSSEAGKRLVLIIDEAQNLDDSVLEMVRMLSNFETPQAKLLQTILVGQPALADKLARPHLSQLRQRISIIAHFSPLRSDEITKYIDHRLRVAGYKRGRLFTPAAMEMIVRFSGGIPRVINNLCFNAMSLSYAKGRRKIDERTLREVITDLSLESMGNQPMNARPHAARRESAAGAGRTRTDSQPVSDRSSQAWGMSDEFLDSVDLSGQRSSWGDEPRWRPSNSPHARPHNSSTSGAQSVVLFLVATAALSIWTWRSQWLVPSMDFVMQTAQDTLAGSDRTASPSARPGDAPFGRNAHIQKPESSANPASNTNGTFGEQSGRQDVSSVSPGATPGIAPPAVTPVAAPGKISLVSGEPQHIPAPGAGKSRKANSPLNRGLIDDLGRRGATGQVVVESELSGAQIRINGQENPKWITPHIFSLVAGAYVVTVSRGNAAVWTRRVHVDRGMKSWVMANLKYDEGKGIFIVDTDPPGMQVFIDGKPYGASRVATTLRSGWHDYEVEPGQGIPPVFGHFHLDAGEALTKRLRLTPGEPSGTPSALLPRSSGGAGDLTSKRFGEAALE